MMPFASPYGSPLYWSFHERPEAWHIDPFYQYAKQLVFFGGGRFTHSTHFHDSSLYGNHGTLTNMAPASDWVRDLGRWALDFDGSDDYVSLPASIPLSSAAGTVALFANCNALPALSLATFPFAARDGDATSTRIYLYAGNVSGVTTWRGSFVDNANLLSGVTVTANQWVHLTIMWLGDTAWMYVDGAQKATASPGVISSVAGIKRIGSYAQVAPGSHFRGDVSDVFAWSRALSPSEISALADPSNVMLSLGGSDPGLIVPDDLVYPVYLPSSVVAGAKPALWLGVCV